MQRIGQRLDFGTQGQPLQPPPGDSARAMECARQLPGDGGRGVGILTKVGRLEYDGFKGVVAIKAPECCFQTVNNIPIATDLLTRGTAVAARRDLLQPRALDGDIAEIQHPVTGATCQRPLQRDRQQAARLQALLRSVRRPRTQLGHGLQIGSPGVAQCYRRQTHDRAIASAAWVVTPRQRMAVLQEPVDRSSRCHTDIEALAGRTPVTVPVPVGVAVHLITRVEGVAARQALGQAHRHGGIVGPLPRL